MIFVPKEVQTAILFKKDFKVSAALTKATANNEFSNLILS